MRLVRTVTQLDEIALNWLPVKLTSERLIKGGLLLIALGACYLVVGVILAYPTDYGRIFTISATSMTACLLAYFFIFQNVVGPLFAFKKRQAIDRIVSSLQASLSQNPHKPVPVTSEQVEMLREMVQIVKKKNDEMNRHSNYAMILLCLFALGAFWIAFYRDFVDRVLTAFLAY
jgi:low affinity Fe/Cu permease